MNAHFRDGRVRAFGTALLLGLIVSSCGGGGRSTAPTPQPPPPPRTTPTNTWSAAGQVVALRTSQGVGGATLTPAWSLPAVTADEQGNYELGDVANPPSTPYPVTVAAAGMISHDVWITWARGPRTGVTLDMIRNAPPFSLDFYRQFVRDTYDQSVGSPWPVLRWTSAPSFYVRTVDQNGRSVEPEVLAVTLDALRRAVPAFTAGHYSAAAIETGGDVRPGAPGWINVDFKRQSGSDVPCGTSFVGRNPGTITLYEDICSCGSVKVPGAVTMHEVGHAMGFFHVGDKNSLMYPFASGACPAGVLSAAELYHAAVAYSRPRGNSDPDHDPASGASLTSRTLEGPLVR
jgi:Matrixin